MAGSKRQRDLAVHLSEKWRIYGFDEVEMPEYKVPLSLPQEDKPNKVEVIINGTVAHTILGKLEASKPHDSLIAILFRERFAIMTAMCG